MPRKPCKNGGSTQLPTNHYLETSCARPLYIFYPFLPISYCSVTELLSCFELFKALAEESFQKHFRNLNTVYPVSQSKCLFMSSKKPPNMYVKSYFALQKKVFYFSITLYFVHVSTSVYQYSFFQFAW